MAPVFPRRKKPTCTECSPLTKEMFFQQDTTIESYLHIVLHDIYTRPHTYTLLLTNSQLLHSQLLLLVLSFSSALYNLHVILREVPSLWSICPFTVPPVPLAALLDNATNYSLCINIKTIFCGKELVVAVVVMVVVNGGFKKEVAMVYIPILF